MTHVDASDPTPRASLGTTGHRRELARELLASALYLCLVLLGAIAATPADAFPDDPLAIKLILGTSVGLMLAHWLAFRLATSVISEQGAWTRHNAQEVLAQLAGGGAVAAVAAGPFVLFDRPTAPLVSVAVLFGLLAAAGVIIARRRGHRWPAASFAGLFVLVLASVVVFVKSNSGK